MRVAFALHWTSLPSSSATTWLASSPALLMMRTKSPRTPRPTCTVAASKLTRPAASVVAGTSSMVTSRNGAGRSTRSPKLGLRSGTS
ncbi:hypothetical protein OV203_37590 [Nannocystis sp. ILAH1]|uniref:hypothetical protein n=1 Tax=Nannocystis sp. ILAH1 TaxID=2996789 RepID=UPI00226F41CA|nr:hypothetical protein [Nannocystis sp. ILAH1]MCY0992915.1 hypothetical protein [Nannocystis sp. ILAH1]